MVLLIIENLDYKVEVSPGHMTKKVNFFQTLLDEYRYDIKNSLFFLKEECRQSKNYE
jgi:hypothetical protein